MNFEDFELETAMESHLPALMVEINRHFDILQASLALSKTLAK